MPTETHRKEFIALLAHELRNPLSPIVTATQIIRRAGIANPAVQQSLVTIERQVQQLIRLVDDLTDMSRLTANKISLQIQACNLGAVCEGAVECNQHALDAKHHQMKVSVQAVEMTGDPTRIQQIVANVLNNAIKFTPNGGEISLSASKDDDHVVLTVQDNGVGISGDALPHVCDSFYQESRTSGSGLGIGLSLAKTLVDMHGGTINVHSDGKGKGTSVMVRLPLATIVAPDHKNVKVLVIDDNVDHANNLSILLEMEDFQCRVAYDGRTGLRELDSFRPDVVFLDIGMPDMDGYEVIASMARENRPYVVAVTGFGQPSDRMKTKVAGFDSHIVKPPQAKELFDILRRIAEQKETA